jgi:hypothetical protein
MSLKASTKVDYRHYCVHSNSMPQRPQGAQLCLHHMQQKQLLVLAANPGGTTKQSTGVHSMHASQHAWHM